MQRPVKKFFKVAVFFYFRGRGTTTATEVTYFSAYYRSTTVATEVTWFYFRRRGSAMVVPWYYRGTAYRWFGGL